MNPKSSVRWIRRTCAALVMAAVMGVLAGPPARAADPIKIGFGMALSGPLAVNGKAALLALQIWASDVNAKGGLVGRPVQLVYYDDQSNPTVVASLYEKLISVDKVDLILGGYATNMIAPAVPVAMQKNMVLIGLFGLAVNAEFHDPKYFSMIPTGPDPEPAFTKGFFDVAMAQTPKPATVAIVAADTEYSRNAADGAKENAAAAGLKIVYDKTYPPTMTDFAPVVRAVQATHPDLVVVCSYPADSVGIIRAADEIGFKPKMLGGAMVGLQSTEIKTSLGPLLNGIVNYDFWLPAQKLQFPETIAFLKTYQAKAATEGVDPLGYYLPPFAYAQAQVLGQAVTATESLDQNKLADYIRTHAFKTILGDVTFARNGEWSQSRVLQVQFQNVKGHDVEQFRGMSTQVILTPKAYQTGTVIYPYADARH